ncbi:SSI family serine proteinase inhibitor [Nocardiopsis xinjiangensis]|uniref:SSI family serine proteinase inhibitor n=1 Tax=Nocardiopsis xinjiangensis TaxID=124285 RepID=UPI00037B56A4|nr:SSI family serine proteinase inhibitor [Nocardiopsis xinjiangensis]
MRMHTIATALPTRLAALAALGLLLTACGNESSEVSTPAPDEDGESTTAPDENGDGADGEASGDAGVELTIERSLSDDESLEPAEGFEEGTYTLTCAPTGGDHPDPETACEQIEEVGEEPFTLDTSDMACTMQVGGPEQAHVTGQVHGTEIDTEFNQRNGCEIERFEELDTVLNP